VTPKSARAPCLDYAPALELLPPPLAAGTYSFRFATSAEDLDAALRLRYEIFNLELGEGLAGSVSTGRDQDPYDPVCHHLLAFAAGVPQPIGTYRMQTREVAQANLGFYTSTLFEVEALPAPMLEQAIEVGRACIAKPYRNRLALFTLWKGLATYMVWNRKRFLFGCCSLTSQDAQEGRSVYRWLRRRGHLHPELRVAPRPACVCFPGEETGPDLAEDEAIEIPRLFGTYLRYGAKVCGPPAIDRDFKTIDFLVTLDVEAMDSTSRELFFG
jgi:putative hemolysin